MANAPESPLRVSPAADGLSDHAETLRVLYAILAELRAIQCGASRAVPSLLLLALSAWFGDGEFTTAEAQADIENDEDIAAGVASIGGAHQLGVALRALANRPAGGVCLVGSGRNRRNATVWRVVTDMTSGTFADVYANVRGHLPIDSMDERS